MNERRKLGRSWGVFFLVMLVMSIARSGGTAFLLFILPLTAIFVVFIISAAKKREEEEAGESTADKARRLTDAPERVGDKPNGLPGPGRTEKGRRTPAPPKPPDAEAWRNPSGMGTASSVPEEMLSESERIHLSSMNSPRHDDFTHKSEELKDLLEAGIIERAEYNDRLRSLRAGR